MDATCKDHKDQIVHSFKICGITAALDSSEDAGINIHGLDCYVVGPVKPRATGSESVGSESTGSDGSDCTESDAEPEAFQVPSHVKRLLESIAVSRLYAGGDCTYKFATKTLWRTIHEKVPMIKNVTMIK